MLKPKASDTHSKVAIPVAGGLPSSARVESLVSHRPLFLGLSALAIAGLVLWGLEKAAKGLSFHALEIGAEGNSGFSAVAGACGNCRKLRGAARL